MKISEKSVDGCVFDLLSVLMRMYFLFWEVLHKGHVTLLYVDDIYLRLESNLRTFYRV